LFGLDTTFTQEVKIAAESRRMNSFFIVAFIRNMVRKHRMLILV